MFPHDRATKVLQRNRAEWNGLFRSSTAETLELIYSASLTRALFLYLWLTLKTTPN